MDEQHFSQMTGQYEKEIGSVKGTNVNMLIAAGIAVGITLVFYLFLIIPGISGTYIHNLFCQRGAIQFATVYFFFWGVMILVMKVKEDKREKKAFELGILDMDPGVLIRQEDALQYIRKIKRLTTEERELMLPNRIWHALVRFKLLGNAEKVDDLLKYQGELDDASMESSYSFLKFIIALVPILGFLGTVLGISQAVAGFSAVIGAAENAGEGGLKAIQDALGNVTIGLATAFDTTLIALIMSAILMFGLTLFQRAEEDLLGSIEEYCIINLLDRLWVPPLEEQFENAVVRAMSNLPKSIAIELKKVLK